MFRFLKRLRERPIKMTARERELLHRENDESSRQAMPDQRRPISRFLNTGSAYKGWASRTVDKQILDKGKAAE